MHIYHCITPWPYDANYSRPYITADELRAETRRASEMYGAAMRGRLNEFLAETEGSTQ